MKVVSIYGRHDVHVEEVGFPKLMSSQAAVIPMAFDGVRRGFQRKYDSTRVETQP